MFPDHSSQLQFHRVSNDKSNQSSKELVLFKSIISKALPVMDRSHIVRLLFDKRHESLIAFANNQMIGGICFAKFPGETFVEVAFLAVKADKRVQGYGKKIINKLKCILQHEGIEYMVTYGDNNALGFFRKQGFSQKITIPLDLLAGYIKEYDQGKLMQCKIHKNVDYMKIEGIIQMQKKYLIDTLKAVSLNDIIFRGSDVKEKCMTNLTRKNIFGDEQKFLRDPRQIPGVVSSGWDWQEHEQISKSQIEPFHLRCKKLIQSIKKHPESKYFLEPVSQKLVPKYRDVIKNPMDFQTMISNLQKSEYKNQQHFCQDIELIFRNCKQFNHPNSVYCRSADKLKKLIEPEVAAFKNGVISTSNEKTIPNPSNKK